ncbi:helix-turn-helix domain-containing protein [Hymenobacter terrenus]|uniref:helix-turn-helix domain-containing protein n=1 Tax=Hymenobacter terrenus TaxID=1629124 RepID=UPI000619DA46|nr:helix-turn-helix domain-containing protein [Hymenobacter terrenus]
MRNCAGFTRSLRRHTLAQLCLALAPYPRRTAAQLADELGFSRQTVVMALALLLPPGFIAYEKAGRNRYTRLGEDWLLLLLTGEPAPAAP